MIIGVPREIDPSEKRVALSPKSVEKLISLGYEVKVEKDCGAESSFADSTYQDAGAEIVSDRHELFQSSDVIVKVLSPNDEECELIKSGATLVSLISPASNGSITEKLSKKNVSTLALDCIPRISRAQKMDVLSSMANIAGYRAVIEAANEYGSVFTGQITAAGKMPPAKVLVIGAGVAGLAAIGTAKSLGAIVRAFDTRLAVKEQVASMGAEFLELQFEESGEGEGGYAKTMSDEFIKAEMELFAQQAKDVDIIVTTALIPGKPAPKLITTEMVESMKPGSVIVDMAAEQGGNCELTEKNKLVNTHGVSIIGYTDFPSRLSKQSSTLFGNNIVHLLSDMTPEKDGQLVFNLEDQAVRGCLVTHQGEVTWPPPKIEVAAPKAVVENKPSGPTPEEIKADATKKAVITISVAAVGVVLLLLAGTFAPASFLTHFTVFVLSCFIGWQVVWNVTPALHTPLMSVTNAISGIILVGAIVQVTSPSNSVSTILAAIAILVAMINIAGGFLVTHRMLGMFRKQES